MDNTLNLKSVVNGVFILIFFALGILNVMYIHVIPGAIYLLLAIMYLPQVNAFFRRGIGFTIPFVIKVVVFLLIAWATLGVSDLFELFESTM